MKENNNNSVGILGLLGIAFVILKLTKVIDWSWWWVLAPFWGGLAIVAIIAVVIGLILIIKHIKNNV